MTDSLEGLSVELRKAAKTYHIYACCDCKRQLVESDMGKQCGFCGMWNYEMDCKISVLPAGLVEKEMRKINEVHNHDLWASMEWGFIVGEKGQMNIQRTRIEFAKTIKK